MTAYVIGKLIVKDWNWYHEYRSVTEPLVAEHGGRYLVKGGEPKLAEGDGPEAHAMVVIAFPNRQAALGWYRDPLYAAMITLRHENGVETELTIVDGFPAEG